MIVDALLRSAELVDDGTLIEDPGGSMTYRQLAALSASIGKRVEAATTQPHVGLLLPSTRAFAATFYGILWAGRTAVPLNFLLQPGELAAIVADAGLDTVFTIRPFADLASHLPVKAVYVDELLATGAPSGLPLGRLPDPPRVGADDVAILLYTSGTSGQPKGVCQTYANIHADVGGCIERAQLQRRHRFLGVLPLFHSFGLTAMLLVPIRLGAAICYVPRFNPATALDAIRAHQSSVTMMIASMYAALLRSKRGGSDDLKTIEYAISGGEALSMAVYEKFRERFGVEILQGYGMTEASPVVSLNIPATNRPGTVGQAIPGVEVRASDDTGRPLPAGQTGELWVRGPVIMKGYYRNEAETRAVITEDGWYRTGDMGLVDREGFITITGRKKEMIIVGGENVYPREIEAVLDEHPAVAESAVIGQADPSRGEVVVAFVTLREGQHTDEITLREFCRGRIAGYKVPRRIIIAADLPRGPTGKILKRRLPELLKAEP